jgi:NAD(P)-dependent dehydrogenase (short-subunit alcohol dehydrogenase family)
MGANFTFPGGGAYHATKYAVDALSDTLRFEVQAFGIDVVIIQPGLIKTEFAATASSDVPETGDGPYAAFNARVAQATKEAYEAGPLSYLGGGPERVARTVERAITAKKPKTRYRVTPSAHLLVGQRAVMTDRLWDAMLRTQFPQPGAKD